MARAATIAVCLASSAACEAADPLAEGTKAYREQDYTAARKFAESAVEAEMDNPEALYLLGQSCLRLRDNPAADSAFTRLIKVDPKEWSAYDGRGDARLKLGQFRDAVADYDRALELNPDFAPKHWRRGIALYYAGDYKAGVEQFETHKTANPEDVENAAWHYLCNARVVGKVKAQAELIAVTRDSRVPMAEIQKLYAGQLKPADVLAAAEKIPADSRAGKEARFYAHLYVGLWYEAEGKAMDAKTTPQEAVNEYKIGHYMWDVGNAHVKSWAGETKAD